METARNAAMETEFLNSLIRLGEADKRHHIWAAVHTLLSSAAVPLMHAGFLPVIPRDMVRTGVHGTSTIIVSSVVSDEEVLPAMISGGEEISDLLSWIEEADARLVVHVDRAVRIKQCKRIVIVSNDTDTFALMLHYFSHFQSLGLQEMWQQYGT